MRQPAGVYRQFLAARQALGRAALKRTAADLCHPSRNKFSKSIIVSALHPQCIGKTHLAGNGGVLAAFDPTLATRGRESI
jgi:hypothetical protein